MKKSRKILLYTLLSLGILFVTAVASFFMILEPRIKIKNWAELDPARLISANRAVTVLDSGGNQISDPICETNRSFTSIKNLNRHTPDAFISIEDKRFYKHKGVDYIRFFGALKNNIFSMRFKEGGSTISQQLIKNTHLTQEKTISRKIQEMRVAIDLERNYSKDAIMEMYLNSLYFGNNVYGINGAAYCYLNKSPEQLSVSESAYLAGIINSPAANNPYTHHDKALKRRNVILWQMKKDGYITETQYDSAINEKIIINSNKKSNEFINGVLAETAKILDCDERDLFKKNLTVRTGYHSDYQKLLEKAAAAEFNQLEKIGINCLLIENSDGRVLANAAFGVKNRSTTLRRPGSTIKPFISYAPAMEKKLITPITPLLDEKTTFGDYAPSNFKDSYNGWSSVEYCLAHSLNIPAVKLMEMTGIEEAKTCAKKFGFVFAGNDNSLTLALGGMENGATLGQITDAYATLARGGQYAKSGYVTAISDSKGKIIYTKLPQYKTAVSTDTAYLITDMLKKCAQTGTAKKLHGVNYVAAKTGTVGTKKGNTDAYCIVYNRDFTLAVWMGSDVLMDNSIGGGTLPSKIAADIFSRLPESRDFDRPSTVVELDVDYNELLLNQKVILCSDSIPQRYRTRALFSADNIPPAQQSNVIEDTDNFFTEEIEPPEDSGNYKITDKIFDFFSNLFR